MCAEPQEITGGLDVPEDAEGADGTANGSKLGASRLTKCKSAVSQRNGIVSMTKEQDDGGYVAIADNLDGYEWDTDSIDGSLIGHTAGIGLVISTPYTVTGKKRANASPNPSTASDVRKHSVRVPVRPASATLPRGHD